jgi:hypothetical protein
VEIWYVRTPIWVVEDRCVLAKCELLVSKLATVQSILTRLRLTLKRYKVAPDSYLARQPTVFKIKDLDLDQFAALLHSETQSHLLTQRMEKIKNHLIEFDDVAIYSSHESIVVNYARGSSSVFDGVPLLKVIDLKEKCLGCGSTENLEICKCKTVFFCSKACREAKKDHLKDCNSLQGEARKYAVVTEMFEVTKKFYPNVGNLVPLGKVGL